MRVGLLSCGLWLAACAPQPQPPTASTPTAPILIEGGVVEGRFVRAAGLQLALPGPTPLVARNGETLLAAYPFQLLVYRNGFIQDSLPLPGVPTFVQAKPLPLVGFADRLYVPGLGTLLYKAKDALHTKEGVYWLDEEGISLERRRLAEGRFNFLAAGERYVYAFGREALRLPDNNRVPLPAGVRAAVVLEDLYVLTSEGLFRLSPEGLRLGFRAGAFSGLQTDGVYLYTLESGRLLTLRLNLDTASRAKTWAQSTQNLPALSVSPTSRFPTPLLTHLRAPREVR
ncbi:MAG: hypothetical protein N2318_07515 [Meiothermus sp.]|nr:hypothetical protein [Meiothermus sp.]